MGKRISDKYYLLPDLEVQWYGYFTQADNQSKCNMEHIRLFKSKKRYKNFITKIKKLKAKK